jgi:hypothetical protein
MGIIAKTLSGGQVVILYRAEKNEQWFGWSQWRGALVNRINKYMKAKGQKSKANQLGWIRMIEQKMAYIEKFSTGGKPFQKRTCFDEGRPDAEIFESED